MNIEVYNYNLLIRGTDLSAEEQEHITKIYKKLGREQTYQIVLKKKILPFAAKAFCSCGVDVAYWESVLAQYRKRNSSILSVLDQAYEELARQGVKKMFVSENFGALLSAGNDTALFASGDVDNHADPGEKEKIYRAFDALGYTRKERYTGAHLIAAEFFPPKREDLPEGFYISVDFYPLARLKLPCFVRSDAFVDWDGVYCYGSTAVKLPPVDALMYICMLHLSLHSFSRAPDIRLYIDPLNMSRLPVDYEKIAVWSRRDKTCTRVAVAAQLSNWLMQTQFPEMLVKLSNKRHRLIKQVYNREKNDLRYEPRGLKVLLIEMLCNDRGILPGLGEILFPNKQWMTKVYGSGGLMAYLKHIYKVL